MLRCLKLMRACAERGRRTLPWNIWLPHQSLIIYILLVNVLLTASDSVFASKTACQTSHAAEHGSTHMADDLFGDQLLRTLAADNCPAHVVLSSGSDVKVLESAMQLGRERGLNMSEALPKPVRVESLKERLAGFKRVSKPLLAADLAGALAADQLFLEYQPKLDCRLGRITGAEALVRWDHPTRGIIQPNQFIGLAEEN